MNYRIWSSVFAAIVLYHGTTTDCIAAPRCQVTIRALEEDGQPISSVAVSAGLENGSTVSSIRGQTDASGLYVLTGETTGNVVWTMRKGGYYESSGFETNFYDRVGGRWQPWNQVIDVVLKKVINPVPMYAKDVSLVRVPAYDRPLGFDLMVGDWVAPHGAGAVSDFVFFNSYRWKSAEDCDYSLTLTFSNPGDGIQPFEAPYHAGSRLKSLHQAPDQGYLPRWVQKRSRIPGEREQGGPPDPKRNYYFRVRSRAAADGGVSRALYGKIYGDFMQFTYYLNPDGTRNMEFDLKRNLLKNLKSWVEPWRP